MRIAPFTSDFAILDVKSGRAALEKRLKDGGSLRVRVEMTIDEPHGADDGTSIAFSCTVLSVKEYGR